MSSLLTPEIIEAIARNAGAINEAMNAQSDAVMLGGHHGDDEECCSPKLLKFKFILCDVKINNINAVVVEDDGPAPCYR